MTIIEGKIPFLWILGKTIRIMILFLYLYFWKNRIVIHDCQRAHIINRFIIVTIVWNHSKRDMEEIRHRPFLPGIAMFGNGKNSKTSWGILFTCKNPNLRIASKEKKCASMPKYTDTKVTWNSNFNFCICHVHFRTVLNKKVDCP